jgi:hypothetical protein
MTRVVVWQMHYAWCDLGQWSCVDVDKGTRRATGWAVSSRSTSQIALLSSIDLHFTGLYIHNVRNEGLQLQLAIFVPSKFIVGRSQWPGKSSPAQAMASLVRIPLEVWIFVCVFCVFILRTADPPSKEPYGLWMTCVFERTTFIPTERPPLVSEVSGNYCGWRVYSRLSNRRTMNRIKKLRKRPRPNKRAVEPLKVK